MTMMMMIWWKWWKLRSAFYFLHQGKHPLAAINTQSPFYRSVMPLACNTPNRHTYTRMHTQQSETFIYDDQASYGDEEHYNPISVSSPVSQFMKMFPSHGHYDYCSVCVLLNDARHNGDCIYKRHNTRIAKWWFVTKINKQIVRHLNPVRIFVMPLGIIHNTQLSRECIEHGTQIRVENKEWVSEWFKLRRGNREVNDMAPRKA